MSQFNRVWGFFFCLLLVSCSQKNRNSVYLSDQDIWIEWSHGEKGYLAFFDGNRIVSDTLFYSQLADDRHIGVYFLSSRRIDVYVNSANTDFILFSTHGLLDCSINTEMSLRVDTSRSISSDFFGIIDKPLSFQESSIEALLLIEANRVGYRSNYLGESDARWILPYVYVAWQAVTRFIKKLKQSSPPKTFHIDGQGYIFTSVQKKGKHFIFVSDSLGRVRDTISWNIQPKHHDGGIAIIRKDSTIVHIYNMYRRTVSFSGMDEFFFMTDDAYTEKYGMSSSRLYGGMIPTSIEKDARFILFFSSDNRMEYVPAINGSCRKTVLWEKSER